MKTSTPAVFSFQSHSVRAYSDDTGEPWFCAADVCDVLGYANSRDALAKHCRAQGVAKRDTPTNSGIQPLAYINEGNLYRLIIKSRKPEAEAFERKLMEEILPAIRKTGSYTAQPAKPALPPKPQIKTRDDLSFTRRDEGGRLVNWSIPHDRNGNWGELYEVGQGFLAEIAELAAHDEREAYHAVQFALSGSQEFRRGQGTGFGNTGWGQESGFAEAIARAVIDGLRARKGGQEAFDPKGGGKKPGRKALPKPKHSALPSLPMPAQQALVLH